MLKVLTALVTVLIGVGAAMALYWALNKLAELLPGRYEGWIKPYLYILPAYAAILFYLIYPAVQTVVYSFKNATGKKWVGLDNFTHLLQNHNFQQTLINTLLWMLVVPVVTVILGLGVAVLADRLGVRAENSVKTLIFMPMAISMVGAGTVWKFLYAYRPPHTDQIGLQNAIVTGLGHGPVPWMEQNQLHFNSFLLMAMLLWAQVGFSMVLLSAAVKGVPGDTLEAARIDGAGERQIFFRVVVPQIKGTLITVYITTLIGVMKIFDIVYVMTNGRNNTNVLGNEFFNQFFVNFDQGAAAAIVVILMVAVMPIMAYQVKHFRNEEAAA
jgi:alpha-glucoside transport system permease protein